MKAVGATNGQVMGVFLAEAATIGGLGGLAGIYPARRAAALDPVVALRAE